MGDDIKGLDEYLKKLQDCQKNAPGRIVDRIDKEAKTIRRMYRKRVKAEANEKKTGKKHLRLGMQILDTQKVGDSYEGYLANNPRKAPHYHLVEKGHRLVIGGRELKKVKGKFYFKRTVEELTPKINKERERWAEKLYKELM